MDVEARRPQPSTHKKTYAFLVAFAAAMGGLLFGYEVGVVSQVLGMPGFRLQFGIKEYATNGEMIDGPNKQLMPALTTSIFLIGCLMGSAFVSWMADFFGRKASILVGGFIFLIGGIFQTAVNTMGIFLFGRWISGYAIGILSVVCPLYIAEASPTDIRGMMVTIQQLMITIGIFLAAAVNSIIIATLQEVNPNLEWRLAMALQCVPALFLFAVMIFMPKSPRWLAQRGRSNAALEVIAKLNAGPVTEERIVQEHKEIMQSIEDEKRAGEGKWSELWKPDIRSRFIVVVVMQAFQQWTGINVIMYYQGMLFEGMGIDERSAAIPFTLANTFINMVATLPGMYLVDRLGRRKLLIWGGMGMALAHFLVCLFTNLSAGPNGNHNLSWGAILAVYLFIFCFASTWGPIAWVYQSEVFPMRVRAKGSSAGTMSNWLWNAVIALITPFIFFKIEFYGYLIFAVMGLLMTVFVYTSVPETSGKSLEEMDALFGVSSSNFPSDESEANLVMENMAAEKKEPLNMSEKKEPRTAW